MANFDNIRIRGINEERSVPPAPGEHRWLLCFDLSAEPPAEWIAALDRQERSRGYGDDFKASVEGDHLFVRSTLSDLRNRRFEQLKREVCHANQNYREALVWQQAHPWEREHTREHQRRALHQVAESLPFD